MAMSTDRCVERIITAMIAKNPAVFGDTELVDQLRDSYKIIVGEILDEVKAATVTLDFATGAAGAPIVSVTSPSGPVVGRGVFSPVPETTQFQVLS